jgi:hypothetical protein
MRRRLAKKQLVAPRRVVAPPRTIAAAAQGATPGPSDRASRGALGSAFGLDPTPSRGGIRDRRDPRSSEPIEILDAVSGPFERHIDATPRHAHRRR